MYSSSLTTDVPYLWVEWYIGNSLVDREWGDGTKTSSSFGSGFSTPGSVQGTKYRIEGYAAFANGANVDWDRIQRGDSQYAVSVLAFRDSDSYLVRMFESLNISGTKYPRDMPDHQKGDGIYGSVSLNGHYHDGRNIIVSGYLYARNDTKKPLYASSWFRHTQFKDLDGDGLDETVWSIEDPRPSKLLSPNAFERNYSQSGSSMITYPLGRNIERGEKIKLNAHVHLEVGGVVWHEEGGAWTHTFERKHNKNYQPD